jgi:hypothetical protein
VLLIQVELEVEAVFVGGAATEAIVAVDALLDFVSVDGFVARHKSKMNYEDRAAQGQRVFTTEARRTRRN